MALVRFAVVDSTGTVVPTADNVVHVALSGVPGSIVALDNGDLENHEPYREDHRAAFNGRGLAIVRAASAGVLRITVSATGLKPATLVLHVVPRIPAAVIEGLR